MQLSAVPRCEYPDRCEREQSRLGQFAKFGLAGEETGDDDSGSDSLSGHDIFHLLFQPILRSFVEHFPLFMSQTFFL